MYSHKNPYTGNAIPRLGSHENEMLNYIIVQSTQCVSDALVVMTFCVSEKHIEERRKMMWLFTLSGQNSNIKHALLSVTHPHDSSGKCNYDASEIDRASYQKIIKNFSKRSCVRVCLVGARYTI